MNYLAKFRFPHKEIFSVRWWKIDKGLILSLYSSNIVTVCLSGIEFAFVKSDLF